MSGNVFKIQFIRTKTCALYIPEKWVKKLLDVKKLEQDSAIKIVNSKGKEAYFGWQPFSTQEDVIGVNAVVATNLGLLEDESVTLTIFPRPPNVTRVEMSPLTYDDLEIIQLSSGILQASLLDQVQVIWKEQFLTAWISHTLPIVLYVGCMDPDVKVGLLQQLTEVVIGDPVSHISPSKVISDSVTNDLLNGLVSSGKSLAKAVVSGAKTVSSQSKKGGAPCSEVTFKKTHFIFRVHPYTSELMKQGPLDAYIPDLHFSKLFQSRRNNIRWLFCNIKKLPSTQDKGTKDSKSSEKGDRNFKKEEEILFSHIRLTGINNLECRGISSISNRECIFISDSLRSKLNLEIGCRVTLSDFKVEPPSTKIERVELYPFDSYGCFNLVNSFLNFLEKTPEGILLSSNMLLSLPLEKDCVDTEVILYPTSASYTLVLPGQVEERQVHVMLKKGTERHKPLLTRTPYLPNNFADNLYLTHLKCVINEGLASLKLTLGLHESNALPISFSKSVSICNNILILGKSGCGKTSMANALCALLQGPPHYIHNAKMSCRPLKGKTVESIFKHLQSSVDDCVYHQPSILIIDDIECIAGAPEDNDQSSQVSSYFNRIGKILLKFFTCLQSNNAVAIIATAPAQSSVSPSLVPPRGVHFFSSILELPELTKSDREGVLEKLLNKKLHNKEVRDVTCFQAIAEFARKTEGYCSRDLADLVDKAILSACIRQVLSSKVPVLDCCDILQAMSENTPMALRGISLHKDSTVGWEDIGGLIHVKNELKEVFEWPVMFPELFQNSPLRQQSGLLLYGAPGTGKTMLAGAVAKECGLNFISVKGPELLSKYIGASEEAVRNVFSKAQSAKPCVLFFDEFDSLAPRRGHDNTGVTDRVVNQLLTQLDGVESLVGVWVLAATSRPDLLDPALLRPGRLDRSVLCPLPDKENRLSILKALSQKMTLDSDVDLSKIAENAEGFTGADLQSILYTAQLKAFEEQQSLVTEGIAQHQKQSLFKVNQSHLDAATSNTRPSLNAQERNKYLNIYKRFGPGKKGDPSSIWTGTQRATLA